MKLETKQLVLEMLKKFLTQEGSEKLKPKAVEISVLKPVSDCEKGDLKEAIEEHESDDEVQDKSFIEDMLEDKLADKEEMEDEEEEDEPKIKSPKQFFRR
jgi:hypothetical protein